MTGAAAATGIGAQPRQWIPGNGTVKIIGVVGSIIIALLGLLNAAWDAHGDMLEKYNKLAIAFTRLEGKVDGHDQKFTSVEALIVSEAKASRASTDVLSANVEALSANVDTLAKTQIKIDRNLAVIKSQTKRRNETWED